MWYAYGSYVDEMLMRADGRNEGEIIMKKGGSRWTLAMKNKATYRVSLIVLSVIVLLVVLYSARIPEGMITLGSLFKVQVLVEEYKGEYGHMPLNLEAVVEFSRTKEIEITGDWLHDEWGNPLIYSVTDGNVAVIMSLGRDGRRGGEGKNADIKVSYDGLGW